MFSVRYGQWIRKECADCCNDFSAHPQATTYNKQQLCLSCRRIRSFQFGMEMRQVMDKFPFLFEKGWKSNVGT